MSLYWNIQFVNYTRFKEKQTLDSLILIDGKWPEADLQP